MSHHRLRRLYDGVTRAPRATGAAVWGALAAAALTIAAIIAAPDQALAQAVSVRPVTIELARDQHATALNITNSGSGPTVIQARAFAWRQANGQELLDPTTQIALSPPFAEIAAGQTQVIRVVLRGANVDHETAYRVVLDQVPAPGPDGIRLAVRISIPVFAEPDLHAASKLAWKIVVHPNGEGELIAANSGLRHVRLTQIHLTYPGKPPTLIDGGAVRYLLPGAERSWRLGAIGTPGDLSQVHVSATSDQGAVNAEASVTIAP